MSEVVGEESVLATGLDDVISHHYVCNETTSNSTECEADETGLDNTKIIVLSVITILTIAGNACVILAIFCRNMKMTRMYYFILHLSLADLLTAFFTLLPEIIWTFTLPYFYGGDIICKMIKFLQMIGPYLSSYVLIMTAIDRYQAICHPLSNCTWTPKRSNIMITTAWIISFVLCLPQVFIFHGDGKFCSADFPATWGMKAYVTWFAFSNFFVPFIFLIFCYGRICHVIWANFNSKTTSSSSSSCSSNNNMFNRIKNFTNHCKKKKNPKVRMRWQSSKTKMAEGKISTEDMVQMEEEEDRQRALIVIEPPSSPNTNPGPATMDIYINNRKSPSGSRRHSFSSGDSSRSPSPPDTSRGIQMGEIRSGNMNQPRTHSVRGISRAKIKTVKLTVVVILGYIVCSAPFICVQLWWVWGNPSQTVVQSMTWLFWLLTLNSVVNPWIYMFFNTNLFESLCRTCCPHISMFNHGGHRSGPNMSHGLTGRASVPDGTTSGTGLFRVKRGGMAGSHTEITMMVATNSMPSASMESLRSINGSEKSGTSGMLNRTSPSGVNGSKVSLSPMV